MAKMNQLLNILGTIGMIAGFVVCSTIVAISIRTIWGKVSSYFSPKNREFMQNYWGVFIVLAVFAYFVVDSIQRDRRDRMYIDGVVSELHELRSRPELSPEERQRIMEICNRFASDQESFEESRNPADMDSRYP